MPSPLGHALAGMAAGWLVDPPRHRDARGTFGRAAVFALAGMVPDADLVFGAHSGPTHGLGAAVIAGAAAWVCGAGSLMRGRKTTAAGRVPAVRVALAVAAAYASHILLDWLGNDTSAPIGIMALWPVSHGYYESRLHVFMAISRRYWLPEFWTYNLRALVRELVILVPLVAAVVLFRRRAGA
jgi:inner membrane protein